MIDRLLNLDLPPVGLYALLLAISWAVTSFVRAASRGRFSARVAALCAAVATWLYLPFEILAWVVSLIAGLAAFLAMRRIPSWFLAPSYPVLWFLGAVYLFDIVFQYVSDTGLTVASGFFLVLGACAVGGTLGELYAK